MKSFEKYQIFVCKTTKPPLNEKVLSALDHERDTKKEIQVLTLKV